MTENVVWHNHEITKEDREGLLKQKSALLWFTGLSGSGKSTIASALQNKLHSEKKLTYILDGDNVRHGLNSDLGFTEKDRVENIRRIGEVSKLFVDAGIITMSAFISPYQKDRQIVKDKLKSNFIEIFVNCNISECEKRDPKGLYKKARMGEIKNFTGIDAPYEIPENPNVEINTSIMSIEECCDLIYSYLLEKKII